MDSRLEGLSQEVKGQGFPRQERGQKWTDKSGLCSQIYWGHAVNHQHRISAIHADDFTVCFYTCPLNRETMVCTHRELWRMKNILRIKEPRIIGPYTESCGFYDAYNHGAIWYKRTYGLQISTHVYIHGLHYIWDIKYALCTDICQSICQSICRRI